MKKLWLSSSIVLLLLSTSEIKAQEKHEFTVQQAVDYGLQNATQVKNALLDVKIQKQVNREVTSAALPQLSGSINGTHYFDAPVQPIPDFISYQVYDVLEKNGVKDGNNTPITNPKNFPDLPFSIYRPWSGGGSIDVQQLLFDGQVFVGLQARNTAMAVSERTADVTKEQIKANIQKIYYQLVVGKKQLGSVDANIDRFEKLLNDTKEIFKNGFAEKLDVDKVTVQLNNLKTEKEKVENQLIAGNAGLKFLLGMPQKDELVLMDSLSEDELKSNILDSNYSYNDRKEIQLLTEVSKLNGYNVKRYQLSRIPTIALFGSYQKNTQLDKFDFFKKETTWYTTSLIGLKVSVPIFDGFARRARIENAKLTYEKSKNTLEQAKQSMDYDVTVARKNMTSALLTVDNQKANVLLAEQVYNTTKKKYEQGLGSNQEIYTSQTELKVAQNNYYGALYDAINAKIDYLKAVGKL